MSVEAAKTGRLHEWVASALDDTPLILSFSLSKAARSETPGVDYRCVYPYVCTRAVILLHKTWPGNEICR
jgi:hypothetical protein